MVSITSNVTIAGPFISLSKSYSESTNTICFSSPSSSMFFHFYSRFQLMNWLLLVLQRHSLGTQLSLQPSKSSCTPSSALCILPYFCMTIKQWQHPKSSLCVSLHFRATLEKYKIGHCLYRTFPVSILSWCLQSSFHLPPGCLLSDPGAHDKHLFMSEL